MGSRGRKPSPYRTAKGWRFVFKGRKYQRSTQAAAYALLADLMAGCGPSPKPTPEPVTVAELVDAWEERKEAMRGKPHTTAAEMLDRLVAWAGETAVRDIGRDFLIDYLAHVRACKAKHGGRLSDETIRKHIRWASSVIGWAHNRGWIRERPELPPVPAPPFRPRAFTPDELARLLALLHGSRTKHFAPLVRFMLETGCRPSEACRMEWADVDVTRRMWTIPEHKVSSRQAKPAAKLIPLSGTALSLLRKAGATWGQRGHVWRSYRGTPYTSRGLCSLLKVRGFSAYRLRHTWCQAAADAGVAYDVIASIMGHTDSAMLRHYCTVADERRHAVAVAIDGLSQPRPVPSGSQPPAEASQGQSNAGSRQQPQRSSGTRRQARRSHRSA